MIKSDKMADIVLSVLEANSRVSKVKVTKQELADFFHTVNVLQCMDRHQEWVNQCPTDVPDGYQPPEKDVEAHGIAAALKGSKGYQLNPDKTVTVIEPVRDIQRYRRDEYAIATQLLPLIPPKGVYFNEAYEAVNLAVGTRNGYAKLNPEQFQLVQDKIFGTLKAKVGSVDRLPGPAQLTEGVALHCGGDVRCDGDLETVPVELLIGLFNREYYDRDLMREIQKLVRKVILSIN